jgi:hypothetical protein
MNEIEASLAAWSPCAPQIDRDRLMFAAGRASVDRLALTAPTPALPLGGRELGSLSSRGRVRVGVPAVPNRFANLRYVWPLATSLSTAAALVMAFLLVQDRAERGSAAGEIGEVQQIAIKPPPQVPAASPPLRGGTALPAVADGTYLALRNRMLTAPADEWSLRTFVNDANREAAGAEDGAARKPPTNRNLLQEYLPSENEPAPARRGSPDPVETPAAFTAERQEAIS